MGRQGSILLIQELASNGERRPYGDRAKRERREIERATKKEIDILKNAVVLLKAVPHTKI